MFKNFLLLAPLLLVVACDPISEEQCRSGDWAGIGFADGTKGRPISILNEYTDICGALGIAPERSLYLQARANGLRRYCTPSSAYDIGRRGGSINPVCTAEEERAMQAAFNHGQAYHEIAEIIDELQDEIGELQGIVADFPDTPDEAQQNEIKRLKRRINRLDDRIFDLERDQRRYARWP